MKTLNLFNSYSNNPSIETREQQTTRLYIILLLLILLILFLYTTFTEQTNTYIINRPTQSVYENLQMKYPDTIECPCTTVTIPYRKFLSINPRYHQICSTGFISPVFIKQLTAFNKTNIYQLDFNMISASYFQWIASHCILSRVVIYNFYVEFQTQLYVNVKVPAPKIFIQQTNDILQSSLDLMTDRFARGSIELLGMTTHYQIVTAYYTSFNLRVTSNGSIRIDPAGFSNCSCFIEPETCSTEAALYSYDSMNNSHTRLSAVKGIRVACLPLISFRQSTFECWYSRECYDEVRCL